MIIGWLGTPLLNLASEKHHTTFILSIAARHWFSFTRSRIRPRCFGWFNCPRCCWRNRKRIRRVIRSAFWLGRQPLFTKPLTVLLLFKLTYLFINRSFVYRRHSLYLRL